MDFGLSEEQVLLKDTVKRFLAEWEADHLKNLTELEERLKDQYFAEQGFSPF